MALVSPFSSGLLQLTKDVEVAHGGFLAALILHTARQYSKGTLKRYNQSNVFSLHFHFLRPASAGKVVLKIGDTKPGPSVSIIHLTIEQDGKNRAVAYALYVKRYSGPNIDC